MQLENNNTSTENQSTPQHKLYLIPNLLGGDSPAIIPDYTKEIIYSLDEFIVENLRNARRYLVKVGIKTAGKQIDDLTFHTLNKRTSPQELGTFLASLEKGEKSIGVISEAGCPAVADPGASIVKIAHQKGLQVEPLVGPSSILLAMMASGMNGQNFAFVGYLPIKQPDRKRRILQLEKWAKNQSQTQIFIETPYRNQHLFNDLLKHCQADTLLCIATDLTLPTASVVTKTIAQWQQVAETIHIHKRPSIFLLGGLKK